MAQIKTLHWERLSAATQSWPAACRESVSGRFRPRGQYVRRESVASCKPTLINAVIDETAGTESGRITSLNPTAAAKN